MVDTTIENILGENTPLIPEDVRAQIDSIHSEFQATSGLDNIYGLATDSYLGDYLPALGYIARLGTMDAILQQTQRDIQLIQALIKAYATLIESFDEKIFSIIDRLGSDAGRVFDYTSDAGINIIWHFGWYFYPGCNSLRNNSYIKYVLAWIGIIRYTNLAIALTGIFLIWYNKTNGHLPLLDVSMTFQFQFLIMLIIVWCSAVAYLPQYFYGWVTPSISICRWFRQLFIGTSNTPEDQIYATAQTVSAALRNISSARSELSQGLRDMVTLTNTNQFKTYYWSKITFFEFLQAITVGGKITSKDQNALVISLGVFNMFPLLRNPSFLIMYAPFIWNRFGWAFLVMIGTTIAVNVALFKNLAKLPLLFIVR